MYFSMIPTTAQVIPTRYTEFSSCQKFMPVQNLDTVHFSSNKPEPSPVNIMILQDDKSDLEDMRKSLQKYFISRGYTPHFQTATGNKGAITLWETSRELPDLLISDHLLEQDHPSYKDSGLDIIRAWVLSGLPKERIIYTSLFEGGHGNKHQDGFIEFWTDEVSSIDGDNHFKNPHLENYLNNLFPLNDGKVARPLKEINADPGAKVSLIDPKRSKVKPEDKWLKVLVDNFRQGPPKEEQKQGWSLYDTAEEQTGWGDALRQQMKALFP
jgi:hypothetical protein